MSRVRAGRLDIGTPEQVRLGFVLADPGRRLAAVMLDYLLIAAVLTAMVVGLLFLPLLAAIGAEAFLGAFFVLASFLLRNFYFPWLELRWQGRTLGKRLLRLRVVARDGGPLTPGMVFARNLPRELEIFLPLVAVFAPQVFLPGGPLWLVPLGLVWVGVLALLPVLTRQRSRLGDLVAGTVVVEDPKVALLPDLVREERPTAAKSPGEGGEPELRFTREQLDLYGIHELHVLEDVLRRDLDPQTEELLGRIAEKVKAKIGWDPERWGVHPARFLTAFYAAQRARLEHKMLFGHRQERKVE